MMEQRSRGRERERERERESVCVRVCVHVWREPHACVCHAFVSVPFPPPLLPSSLTSPHKRPRPSIARTTYVNSASGTAGGWNGVAGMCTSISVRSTEPHCFLITRKPAAVRYVVGPSHSSVTSCAALWRACTVGRGGERSRGREWRGYACVHVCLELVLTAVCACLQLHHHPIRPPSRCIGLHCYCELQCEQALHLSHAFPPRTRKFSGWSGRRMHLPLKSVACDAVHLQIPSTHAASSVHHKCRGACG